MAWRKEKGYEKVMMKIGWHSFHFIYYYYDDDDDIMISNTFIRYFQYEGKSIKIMKESKFQSLPSLKEKSRIWIALGVIKYEREKISRVFS